MACGHLKAKLDSHQNCLSSSHVALLQRRDSQAGHAVSARETADVVKYFTSEELAVGMDGMRK
jgi:hypothetical protein